MGLISIDEGGLVIILCYMLEDVVPFITTHCEIFDYKCIHQKLSSNDGKLSLLMHSF